MIPILLAVLQALPTIAIGVSIVFKAFNDKTKSRSDKLRDILDAAFLSTEGLANKGAFGNSSDKLAHYLTEVRTAMQALGYRQLNAQEEDTAKAWARMKANGQKSVLNGVNKR